MYRTHTNGELRASNINEEVTLSGWVQKTRNKGFLIWVDLRDRYGLTQLIFDEERTAKEVMTQANELGREFVIQVKGTVIERESKNPNMPTGDVEILVSELTILNDALTPPFTIEDDNTRYSRTLQALPKQISVLHEYEIKRDHVPTEKVAKYITNLHEIRDSLYFSVMVQNDTQQRAEKDQLRSRLRDALKRR